VLWISPPYLVQLLDQGKIPLGPALPSRFEYEIHDDGAVLGLQANSLGA